MSFISQPLISIKVRFLSVRQLGGVPPLFKGSTHSHSCRYAQVWNITNETGITLTPTTVTTASMQHC